MNSPGFSAELSLPGTRLHYPAHATLSLRRRRREILPQRRGLGSTLPTCGWENCRTAIVYEICGSPLPGAPPPMCPAGTRTECDYVCRWPGGAKGMM